MSGEEILGLRPRPRSFLRRSRVYRPMDGREDGCGNRFPAPDHRLDEPRPSYPSTGCPPAEPVSVSLGTVISSRLRVSCQPLAATPLSRFPGGFEFPVPSLKDLPGPSFKLILRRHVAYCAVQAYGIVPSDVTRYQPPRIRRRKGCAGRMHSRLSVPCRRSILPLLCGWYGEVRTWVMPQIRMKSGSSRKCVPHILCGRQQDMTKFDFARSTRRPDCRQRAKL